MYEYNLLEYGKDILVKGSYQECIQLYTQMVSNPSKDLHLVLIRSDGMLMKKFKGGLETSWFGLLDVGLNFGYSDLKKVWSDLLSKKAFLRFVCEDDCRGGRLYPRIDYHVNGVVTKIEESRLDFIVDSILRVLPLGLGDNIGKMRIILGYLDEPSQKSHLAYWKTKDDINGDTLIIKQY